MSGLPSRPTNASLRRLVILPRWVLALLIALPFSLTAAPPGDLFQAVAANDLSRVEALIRAGANVNARNPDGLTPLDLATSLEMIERLRKAGAMTSKEMDEGVDDPDEEWDMCCAPPSEPPVPEV